MDVADYMVIREHIKCLHRSNTRLTEKCKELDELSKLLAEQYNFLRAELDRMSDRVTALEAQAVATKRGFFSWL